MSIRVVCPNGHVLNVKDSMAGKVGLCPRCKARVEVSRPSTDELSEDAIMGILAPTGSASTGPASGSMPAAGAETSAPAEVEKSSPPKKSCHKCNQEILAGIHICPHCHTYIAKLNDF